MASDVTQLLWAVREREIDRDFLPADLLDVRRRPRTSAFPWRGQFTPGLPKLLMEAYDTGEGAILDPFMGSGTTLIEAIRRGRPSVGVEVNPAAVTLAGPLEFAALDSAARLDLIKEAKQQIISTFGKPTAGLFGQDGDAPERADHRLADLAVASRPPLDLLFRGTLLLGMGDRRSAADWQIVKAWRAVEGLLSGMPGRPVPCSVLLGDARATGLQDDFSGLVLTSPPYINVFNYHQNYRPAVELLGWEVLPAARAEIGSNRKHRGNRFLTVIQYAQDMSLALMEMMRVSRPGAKIVLVVGRESRVRGVPFANGEILATIAEWLAAPVFVRWQERQFVNRFGVRIFEEILTFRVDEPVRSPALDPVAFGRDLGVVLLEEALSRRHSDTAEDIRAAITAAPGVVPSPLPEQVAGQLSRSA
jgi:hypothetical protein